MASMTSGMMQQTTCWVRSVRWADADGLEEFCFDLTCQVGFVNLVGHGEICTSTHC